MIMTTTERLLTNNVTLHLPLDLCTIVVQYLRLTDCDRMRMWLRHTSWNEPKKMVASKDRVCFVLSFSPGDVAFRDSSSLHYAWYKIESLVAFAHRKHGSPCDIERDWFFRDLLEAIRIHEQLKLVLEDDSLRLDIG